MANSASVLVLYVGPNCHLCADAEILLEELIGADAYRVVDISADADLIRLYGGRVPVVTVDGVDRLEAPITGPDLVDLMAELGVSV
ncbi:MAG: glutaredoxin family protein [Candidatus Limnocylindria bacterium]